MTSTIDLFRQTSVRDLVFNERAAILARHVEIESIEAFRLAIPLLSETTNKRFAREKIDEHLNSDAFQARQKIATQSSRLALGVSTEVTGPFEKCADLCLLAHHIASGLNRDNRDMSVATDLASLWEVGTKGSQIDALPDIWCADLLALYAKSSAHTRYRQFLAGLARVLSTHAIFEPSAIHDSMVLASSDAESTPSAERVVRDSPLVAEKNNSPIWHLFHSRIILPAGLMPLPPENDESDPEHSSPVRGEEKPIARGGAANEKRIRRTPRIRKETKK